MRSKFSLVRSSHDLCAHAHSLDGTLVATVECCLECYGIIAVEIVTFD